MKLFFALFLLFSVKSFAYYSVMDTGQILGPDTYLASIGPEFIMSGDNEGANVTGRFDAHMGKSTNLRALLGTGEVDLYGGMFFKYVPYPDFEKQPALGIIFGALYGREQYGTRKEDALTIQVSPFVSKKYDTDLGELTPYLALPVGFRFIDGETEYPLNLAIGSRLQPPDWNGFSIFSELGLKINKSFSYINVALAYEFDDIEQK